MRRATAIVLALCLAILVPQATAAQDRAALIADRISIEPGNRLRAEGNVEILFRDLRLRAAAITYNGDRDQITIEGPMTLADARGEAIFLADSGQLSDDFQQGILIGARVVLAQRLQIAGAELRRIDGRYTELFQAVATTCQVCDADSQPLWQIRATRVVHDQQRRRVYFDNALFEVGGFPIFYVPRLRMPDASVDRASGFLIPNIKNSTAMGTGIEIPYFQTLGPHADVTLTPYVAARSTTFGLGYRQLFRTGAVTLDAAVSRDELRPDTTRGYLFGRGVFFLPRDYRLRFNLELSSDDAYLSDYGISSQDRSRTDVGIGRTRARTHFFAEAVSFRSFRDDEDVSTIPAEVGKIDFRRRFRDPLFGGQSELSLQAYGFARPSDADVLGRDYGRLSLGLDWSRDAILSPGIRVATLARADIDHYVIGQDSTVGEGGTRVTALAGLDVSLPLIAKSAAGVTHLLEPRVQFVASNARASDIPNEESTLVEFDDGALWSLDRVPGSTDYEIGNRINAGLSWTRRDPGGWDSRVTVGRVIRDTDGAQFNDATGLQGHASDWLVAGAIDFSDSLSLASRMLLGGDLSVERNDLRVSWAPEGFRIDTNFLWHAAEPEVGRDLDTWELHADASFPLGQRWEGAIDLRYDFVTNRTASAGVLLTYKSQCITANLGFESSFTSSDAVSPNTSFTIALSVPPVAVASKRPTMKCSR